MDLGPLRERRSIPREQPAEQPQRIETPAQPVRERELVPAGK